MKALKKSIYAAYEVCEAFNKIILSDLDSYNGTKKEQLKSFLEDLQNGGCMSGMISEFIYHSDCKEFYIGHLDDLENIKDEIEDSLGESVKNRHRLPHYTFMCWLCFEEYCYDIYRNSFE
ncbi:MULTISPECIES: hypothetical protein [unclassified Flavobacterium]|uniref:DUF7222 domain-containing protein n=1 Tax=unclassified Flavobacterium TaxID=196869 RepID=UPI00057E4BDD|nr:MULTISPECIES: hypothetical protein [unclassified Flavobacterium]KIA95650.1 hypothetical protein OA93_18045 [Flavobacterium sp. KMS]OUL62819.1 hypothetical protein B8T70_08195 [Flavobacterium sp. AJR]